MESVLLIAQAAQARTLKSRLLKGGFRVTAVSPEDFSRLEEGRFALCVADAAGSVRLADLVAGIRKVAALSDLPLVLVIRPPQLEELMSVGGVEDYLLAPADGDELAARLRFLLKRMNHAGPGDGIRVGDLEILPDRYEVRLEGQPLELTYKEFELFKFLAAHPNRVFSRDQLLNQVWGYDFIGGTRTVDVHIRRLRAKLGPRYASLIETVRNVGYKFLERL